MDNSIPIVKAEAIDYNNLQTLDNVIYLGISHEDRKSFIVKVYSILYIQLLLTSFYIGLCHYFDSIQKFLISDIGLDIFFLTFMSMFIITCMIYCNPEIFKEKPYNWYGLIIFTLLMIYNIGIITTFIPTNVLLLSGISTIGIFSGLTLYAVQSEIDYTVKGNILLILTLGVIIYGISLNLINLELNNIIYGIITSCLFSFYIVYDTQQIVGGNNRKITYTKDDFVLASINLYLDIINLFLSITNIHDN